MEVDGQGTFKLTLQRLSLTTGQVTVSETHSNWKGLAWTYTAQTHTGTVAVDEYREILSRNGLGQRTGMMDGSGNTTWSYDNRARLILENKAVIGSGSFVTQYGYNVAGMQAWIKYPGDNAGNLGEKVTYS